MTQTHTGHNPRFHMPQLHINDEPQNNADAFQRIRNIDPDIKIVVLDCEVDNHHIRGRHACEDFGLLGLCIGQNESVQGIRINGYNSSAPQIGIVQDCFSSGILASEWETFFDGVSTSRSITQIYLGYCRLDGYVLKLFDVSNLMKVSIHHCVITSLTASAIRWGTGWQEVSLSRCIYLNIADVAGFISLLNHNHTLKCLQLYASFFLHNEEHSALNDMLSDPKSIISKLSLCGAHCSLRPNQNGLVISPSLCHLQFVGPNFMTQQDWQEVRDVVSSPYTALTVLEVDACSIDDARADALSAGLVHSNTLEWVVLSNLTSITVHGWLSILSSLQNSNSTLKHILLHNSDTINDEVVSMFGEVLAAKKNIVKGFRLSSCTSITAAGWTALSVALLTPMLKLRKLVIGNFNFDDEALVAFTNV